jgi:hypothetical protein
LYVVASKRSGIACMRGDAGEVAIAQDFAEAAAGRDLERSEVTDGVAVQRPP